MLLMKGRILVRRTAWFGLAAVALLAITLAGCGGEPAWTGIEGYVTAGRGDNALPNVEVGLYAAAEVPDTYKPVTPLPGAIRTAVTNSAGYYRFEGLAPGTYLVQVASTASRAGARYQHLVVRRDKHLRADLIVFPNFTADAPTVLPSVVSITAGGALVQPGRICTGTIALTITAAAGDAARPIKEIIVKAGHMSNGSDFILDNGEASASFNFDTTRYGDGESFIYVTVYDLNDNAASILMPITIQNNLAAFRPSAPEIVRVEAWTFAEATGTKSISSRSRLPALPPRKIFLPGGPVYLPAGSAFGTGTRALSGPGSAMVHIQIKPSADAASYRIYRRIGFSGPFVSIGERANKPAWYETAYYLNSSGEFEALWFNDLDPALAVGQECFYRVAAVNQAGETDSGYDYHVKILPKFTASLTTPALNAIVDLKASPTPVFGWTASGGVGDIGFTGFLIYVLNKNDENADFSWLHWVDGKTSEIYGKVDGLDSPPKALVPNAIYEWDLAYAYSAAQYEGMALGESYAAMFSYPSVDFGSSNGAFTFTTTP